MTEISASQELQAGVRRKVGAALGIGILLLPWLFTWFLLRRGYSVLARLIGFGWMLLTFLLVIASGNSADKATTASATPATAEAGAKATPAAKRKSATKTAAQGAAQESSASEESAPEATTRLTASQRNAVRSAKQYLRMTGFSREGLIDQLASNAGDGYGVADATAAVDSLDVDWNANAVKSAKQYLNLSGFSCQGLIEQLSSSSGDKYTQSQATYGARQAGACS